ncbi:hypothetical protein [Methylobacterium sp. JK268]
MRWVASAVVRLVLLGHVAAAQAAEWRFCYGTEPASRTFYLTVPFTTSSGMTAVETTFRQRLAADGLAVAQVGCPLGADRRDLDGRIAIAVHHERENGMRIVSLDWPSGDPIAAVR